MRRMIAVAAICTAGLTLVACKAPGSDASGSPSASASSTSSPSSTAAAGRSETVKITRKLSGAVRKLGTQSFQFEGGSGIARIDGSFDPTTKHGKIHGSFGIGAAEVLVLGSDLYVKGIAKQPGTWLHIDTGRLAPGNVLTQATDPTLSTGYLSAIDSATEVAPNQYRGTIDVDKLSKDAASSDRNATALLKLLGAHPSNVTFEASLDSAGRLSQVSVTVPKSGNTSSTTVTTRYHNYGTPVEVSRPSADHVQEAPHQLYSVLAP